jgi:hypothetical protein
MKPFLLLTIWLLVCLTNHPAAACTGIALDDGKRVLVGNNEDWFNIRTKVWFIQPMQNRYGCVFFGFDNLRPQGGMNQKGLFFDVYALREREIPDQTGKPSFERDQIKEMMVTCATVEEALTLIGEYQRDFLDRRQLFVADATGDAAIIEGNAVVRKTGDYQIVTNFRQSWTAPELSSCGRYEIAANIMAGCQGDKLNCIRRILAATHQEGGYPTLYSNIYDLTAKKVYVYYFHNFQEEVVIDLEEALEASTGVMDLASLFPPNYAARKQASLYTRLTKTYTHPSPRFVVRYPGVYESQTPLDEDQVFQAKSRNGDIPVLTIGVTPAPDGKPLSQVAGDIYAPRLRTLGDRVRILSNKPVTLSGGLDAYEARFSWKLKKGRARLNSLVLSTFREGSLISVGLHNIGEVDYLKHIPYSLSFD